MNRDVCQHFHPVDQECRECAAEPVVNQQLTTEPVAWELRMGKTDRVLMEITNNPQRAQDWRASLCEVVPLYYAPTPRKPLTDEDVKTIWDSGMKYAPGEMRVLAFARALEKAHGIGGSE